MSKKVMSIGGLFVIAGLFVFSILRVDHVPPSGQVRLCVWRSVAVDAAWSPATTSVVRGELCEGRVAGLQFSFQMISTDKENTTINMEALRRGYSRLTKASELPATDFSLHAMLSLPRLLWGNTLPSPVYMSRDGRSGYTVTEITEKAVLVGVWASDVPVSAAQVNSDLQIRVNPKGKFTLGTLWIKLGNLAALMFVLPALFAALGGRAIFRMIDQWRDIRTLPGLVAYVLAYPALLLGYGWIILRASGWSTLLLLTVPLLVAALLRIPWTLVQERGPALTLRPFDSESLPVFPTLRSSETTIDVLGADVPMGRSLDAELWFPRRVKCEGCGLHYAVYVPCAASEPLGRAIEKGEDVPAETKQRLYSKAVQSAPQVVNGCLRCGTPVSKGEGSVSVDDKSVLNPSFMIAAIAAFAVALLIVFRGKVVVDLAEKVPLIGGLLGYVVDEGSGLVIFLLALPFLVWIGTYISKSSNRASLAQKGLRRIYACEKEGMIFEDMEAKRDTTECPSCKGVLEPLRRFKLAENL